MTLYNVAVSVFNRNAKIYGNSWQFDKDIDFLQQVITDTERLNQSYNTENYTTVYINLWMSALSHRMMLLPGENNIKHLMELVPWPAEPGDFNEKETLERLMVCAKSNGNFDLITKLMLIAIHHNIDKKTLFSVISERAKQDIAQKEYVTI